MVQEVYIIDDKKELIENLKEEFKEDSEYQFKTAGTDNLEEALRNIPSLIIIDEDTAQMEILELCKKIRADEDNSITPIVVVFVFVVLVLFAVFASVTVLLLIIFVPSTP